MFTAECRLREKSYAHSDPFNFGAPHKRPTTNDTITQAEPTDNAPKVGYHLRKKSHGKLLALMTAIFFYEGRLKRKKNRKESTVLAVREEIEGAVSKNFRVPRNKYDFLYLESTLRLTVMHDGTVQDVELIQAAPDPHSVKHALSCIFASKMDPTVVCSTLEEIQELDPTNDLYIRSKVVPKLVKRIQGRENDPPRKRLPRRSCTRSRGAN